MNELSRLQAPRGANKKRKRVGRGQASGTGKTAGRGGKGQKARTGNMNFGGFEGGQMPIQRRMPKRGFSNPFRTEYATINVGALSRFPAGSTVDLTLLEESGLVKRPRAGLKVLGDGELKARLTVRASRFSAAAKEKIEKAGGVAELVGPGPAVAAKG